MQDKSDEMHLEQEVNELVLELMGDLGPAEPAKEQAASAPGPVRQRSDRAEQSKQVL